MAEQIPFGADSFAENPEPRVPCVLVLDTSHSMHGERIAELNAGLALCKSELSADSLASKRVELAVVTFGDQVTVAAHFSTIDQFAVPQLAASGNTPLGAAVTQAIDLVSDRKSVYKRNGIAYYRPWIFLITDGQPTDDWHDAALRAREGARNRGFLFFSVGVEGADFDVLRRFSESEPLKLKGLRFRDLFQWLSSSLGSVSHSALTDTVKMSNPVTPAGWGEIPAGN